jgi:phosphatidylserine/phosphatidylglycerophosphate/cardiolipin synthase-like enzyme
MVPDRSCTVGPAMPDLEVEFLTDGDRSPASVADELSAFVAEAERSLHVAIYDFDAAAPGASRVARAMEEAAGRGVQVRVVFNLERRPPHPPRPPKGDPGVIDGLDVPTRGVRGDQGLMHHKYVVRDGADVWTGSLNWTDDAFSREENVIVRVRSQAIAQAFELNFQSLWNRQHVEGSVTPSVVDHVDGTSVHAMFSPEEPPIAHLIAERLGSATRRIRILTPVLTSGPILGTLAEFAGRTSFDLSGAYDWTQMQDVQAQWLTVPPNHWKLQAWSVIEPRLSGKRSTPYGPGSVHDYMHAKVVVADGEVLTGSYNCSRGGNDNAENVLRIDGSEMADRFAQYADQVTARYAP